MARPRAFDEDEVIEKAVDVFWTKGYADTSICDLEQALGMGRQSLYNTFGGKRGLFVRALQHYYEQGSDRINDVFGGSLRGLDAIETYLEGCVLAMTASEDRLGCFLTRCMIDHGTVDQDVASRCHSNEAKLKRVFSKALVEAKEDGKVDDSVSTEAAAAMLSTHVYGLSVMARAGATPQDMQEGVDLLLNRLKH